MKLIKKTKSVALELRQAIRHDRADKIKALLSGVELIEEGLLGEACCNSTLEVVTLLIPHVADLGESDNWPLRAAAKRETGYGIVKALLDAGAVADSRVLQRAVLSGNKETIALLSTKVDATEAIIEAFSSLQLDIAEMLMETIIVTPALASLALQEVANKHAASVAIEMLLGFDADPNSGIKSAVHSGYAQNVKLLLDAGATPDGDCLVVSRAYGYDNVTELLLNAGVDPASENPELEKHIKYIASCKSAGSSDGYRRRYNTI